MFKNIVVFVIAICSSLPILGREFARPHNFRQAKNIANHIFMNYPETIYSGCQLGAAKHVDLNSCGFKPNVNSPRDLRLEYEHLLPMASAKHHFKCWREPLCVNAKGRTFKGRRCCQQIDQSFQQLEGELFNLWPEVGSINQARHDFKFTEFSDVEKKRLGRYRGLPIYIDFKYKRIEPRDEAKGLVARASLFVFRQYKIRLSQAQLKLFQYWNKKYPPKEMELKWAAKIAKIEGYPNTFISEWDEH